MDCAARLLGVTDAWNAKFQYVRSPRERHERMECQASVRKALGETKFIQALAAGQALSIEQAVIEAQKFIQGNISFRHDSWRISS
jgi:hypothetical protein